MEMLQRTSLKKIASIPIALMLACIAANISFLPFAFLALTLSSPFDFILIVVGIGLALLSGILSFRKLYRYFGRQLLGL